MSLRRINRIAFYAAREFAAKLRLTILQKPAFLKGHVVHRVLPKFQPFRSAFARVFRPALRSSRSFLRPFAALHHNFNYRRPTVYNRRARGTLGYRDVNQFGVFELVKALFGTNRRYNNALNIHFFPNNLDGYEIGSYIACGCNAAVYELREKRILDVHLMERSKPKQEELYPLALKIMFNYDYDSPERHLWMEMGPELVPLLNIPSAALHGKMANFKPLKRSHPNLIKLHTAFVDRMPLLPNAENLYPEALPNFHYYETLTNVPKTFFIVMKRYQMTLHDYVRKEKRNYWYGRVIFGQLLEAVVFLYQHKISHRDMKSDNVLLEFDCENDVPHLVVSDFGASLACDGWTMSYDDETVDLGGNLALRAPEIRRARPGKGVVVNFSMADTWSSATIGYEIFTRFNPFYSLLSSETYSEDQLPCLPVRIPISIKAVIHDMLRVSPSQRLRPHVAANVVSLSLFRFGKDVKSCLEECGLNSTLLQLLKAKKWFNLSLKSFIDEVDKRIDNIVEMYAAETILSKFITPSVISRAELQLRATFLARIDRKEVLEALRYVLEEVGQPEPSEEILRRRADDDAEKCCFSSAIDI